MNIYFLIAGILSFLLGVIHSILGEYLIFNDKREKGNLVPTKMNEAINVKHLRIIWSTWHLLSFFGWGIAAILVKLSLTTEILNSELIRFMLNSCIITMIASSLLVLIGTKGKHPGWIVLLIIGILLLKGSL